MEPWSLGALEPWSLGALEPWSPGALKSEASWRGANQKLPTIKENTSHSKLTVRVGLKN